MLYIFLSSVCCVFPFGTHILTLKPHYIKRFSDNNVHKHQRSELCIFEPWIIPRIFSCSAAETPMLSKASRVPQSGQICVLGYFLDRAGTPPYCAPQSGQARTVVALSVFITTPPTVLQRGEKNALVKVEIPVPVKTGSYIRATWRP